MGVSFDRNSLLKELLAVSIRGIRIEVMPAHLELALWAPKDGLAGPHKHNLPTVRVAG